MKSIHICKHIYTFKICINFVQNCSSRKKDGPEVKNNNNNNNNNKSIMILLQKKRNI